MLTSRDPNVDDDAHLGSKRRSDFIRAFDRSPTPEEIEAYNRAKAGRRKWEWR